MKAKPSILILNSRLGYCLQPLHFTSHRQAVLYGRQAVKDGFCWEFRVFNANK